VFIVGTEVRVRTEGGLLASRFGNWFRNYEGSLPAYTSLLK